MRQVVEEPLEETEKEPDAWQVIDDRTVVRRNAPQLKGESQEEQNQVDRKHSKTGRALTK